MFGQRCLPLHLCEGVLSIDETMDLVHVGDGAKLLPVLLKRFLRNIFHQTAKYRTRFVHFASIQHMDRVDL